jgi:hypothetical protein
MKRKQGRAENQGIRVCLCACVCVCVCGIQAPRFKASAASREDVPPPHNMSGSRESFI